VPGFDHQASSNAPWRGAIDALVKADRETQFQAWKIWRASC
jgi:hypothetical protein